MSEIKGKLVTCDRCHHTIFLKYLRRNELDGGFSPGYDKYEDLPDEWGYECKIGHLCPRCNNEFKDIIGKFVENYNKEKENE